MTVFWLHSLQDEIPYSCEVVIDSFKDKTPQLSVIEACIVVSKSASWPVREYRVTEWEKKEDMMIMLKREREHLRNERGFFKSSQEIPCFDILPLTLHVSSHESHQDSISLSLSLSLYFSIPLCPYFSTPLYSSLPISIPLYHYLSLSLSLSPYFYLSLSLSISLPFPLPFLLHRALLSDQQGQPEGNLNRQGRHEAQGTWNHGQGKTREGKRQC